MKNRRICQLLSLCLTLVLCLSFLASCGKTDTTPESKQTEKAEQTKEAGQAAEEEEQTKNAETETQSSEPADKQKAVTIAEWLNANGNLGLWTMTVTVKSVDNAESATVTDASGKEVNLSSVYRDKAIVNFTTLKAQVDDVLVIQNGTYNKSGDTVTIKDAQLLEFRPTTRTSVNADYDFSGQESLMVTGQTFENDLILTGTNGRIIFIGCTFRGNITLIGGEDARVMMMADCTFAETSKCIILSSVVEANISTSLPKFLMFCNMPEVICVNSGAGVCNATQNAVFNGRTYAIADSAKYIDEDIGEDTIVPYTGQTADLHNVSVWTESGEEAYLQVAIKTETN